MSTTGYLNSPFVSPRPSSRPSSRNSGRSTSPVVTLADEQVAIRTQMSTLQHNIRHQQAQLTTLRNSILRGPRPYPPGILDSPPMSPAEFDDFGPPSSFTPRLAKRSSFEVLQGMAGPESSLPLPKPSRRSSFGEENGIREGVPTSSSKRAASPTRTLSRNARALAEEGQQDNGLSSSQLSPMQPGPSMSLASSPNRRSSFAPGNTTKVLADLQAGVLNAKNALENTKAQLRISQRQVSQLTRQTEDLKEVRERLRLENEGLNNVVARKERLLQEVLERARKAEAEVISLKAQLKSETTTSKKSMRDMESSLTESTARSQKAEREYLVLRDSLKGLTQSFQKDTENLREEMRRREEKTRAEAEELGKKYAKLVADVRKEREESEAGEIRRLKEENERIRQQLEDAFRDDLVQLKTEMDKSSKESEEAVQTAKSLALELARLRRLMREAPSASLSDIIEAPPPASSA